MDVVTGSFGYIGKYITHELLNKGRKVKTITTHPNKPNPQILFIHVWPSLGIFLGKIISFIVKDVVLTKDELRGLMVNKLTSTQEPNGKTLFSEWLHENRGSIGSVYTSELSRHFYWRGAA